MHFLLLIAYALKSAVLNATLLAASFGAFHFLPSPFPTLPKLAPNNPPPPTITTTIHLSDPITLKTLVPFPFKNTAASTSSPSPISIKKSPKPTAAVPAPRAPTIPTPPPAAPTPVQTIPLSEINSMTRAAIVNILCNVGGTGSLNPISGTGIIIDPSGIVLTNAHIGQFFLLRDYPTKNNIECMLRTGNPAKPAYRAELLYIPTAWIELNAKKLVEQNPTGTGERDYALLHITGRIDGSSLEEPLPYLSPYTGDAFDLGETTLLAGYPAGFIEGITIQTNLFVSSAYGKIGEVFTFKEGGGADLISVPGTIISQKGASGGAAVRASDGKLIGLIATASLNGDTAKRDLRAVTLAHIDRSLIIDTGHNLIYLLTNDPEATARLFNLNQAPVLTKILLKALSRQ